MAMRRAPHGVSPLQALFNLLFLVLLFIAISAGKL